jgi:molybdopterin converting factor small subunit
MVEVSVKLLGTLKEFSGGKVLRLSFEREPRVGEVIQRLGADLGPSFQKIFPDSISRRSLYNILMLVKGFEIGVLQGMETSVGDGDEVVILPVSHGG